MCLSRCPWHAVRSLNADVTKPYPKLDTDAYWLSKTLAEQAAWRLIREQSRVELAVVNPSFVLGPPFSTRTDSTSIAVVKRLIEGEFAVRLRSSYNRELLLIIVWESRAELLVFVSESSTFEMWLKLTSRP